MKEIIIKSILFTLVFPFYSFSESIKVIPGAAPVMVSAKTTINLNDYVGYGPVYSSGSPKANITGFIYGSTPYGSSAIDCSANYMATWKCVDGYCGITVNRSTSDVIYIPAGNVEAKFAIAYNNLAQSAGSVSFNLNSPPSFSNAIQPSNNIACFPQSTYPNDFYINGNARTDFTASLDWYVYAAKSAQDKQVVAEQIDITGVFGASWGSRVAIPANTVNVRYPLNCTISAPPTIDFGTVNLWNFAGNSTGSPGGARKDVLASVDGNLSISCNSNSPNNTTTAKLTLKGPIQGYTNDLKMTMDGTGNVAPATVRASFVNIGSTCNSSGLHFGPGSGVPSNEISIEQLRVGSNDIPYRFFLCALPDVGINQFGSASAQATITLDWD